jgi:carbonic anhydrase
MKHICLVIVYSLLTLSSLDVLDYTESNWPAVCKTGVRQTPINFSRNMTYIDAGNYFRLLERDYAPYTGSLSVRDFKSYGLNMTNQGTLWITKNNIKYKYNLIDMHIHVKSEHTFEGTQYDMEMHFVHQKDQDWINSLTQIDTADSMNSLLVIGIMFNSGAIDPHPTIQKLDFENLRPFSNLNLNDLVDINSGFYHYLGSLTTPGCSETVNWVVLQNVLQITTAQAQAMARWVGGVYKNGNARMIQPLGNRTVWASRQKVQTVNFIAGEWYGFSKYFLLLLLIFMI